MTSLRQALTLEDGGVISLVGAGGKTSLMFRIARELSANGQSVLTTTTTKMMMPERSQSPCVIFGAAADTVLHQARSLLKKNPHMTAAAGKLQDERKIGGLQPETIDLLWQSGLFRWIIVEADGAAGRPLKVPADHEPVIPDCTQWLIGLVGLKAVGKTLNESWVFRSGLFEKITGLPQGQAVTAEAIAIAVVHPKGIMKGAPAPARRLAFFNQADLPDMLKAARRIAGILVGKCRTALHRVVIGQVLYDPPVLECWEVNPNSSGGFSAQHLR
ncbi:MAG: putative selenium-dependent hydroxylase accessory protein YqeC [Desulfobacterales bacterium]|nr:MAG: putative selenium-dependent hydroxylase accessory protein YqeC [Desulfobacterales bacterium]